MGARTRITPPWSRRVYRLSDRTMPRRTLRTVDEAVVRLRTVEDDLGGLLTLEPLRPRAERLRCFRGIDELTALTIAAELSGQRALSLSALPHGVCRPRAIGTFQRRERTRGAITKPGTPISVA